MHRSAESRSIGRWIGVVAFGITLMSIFLMWTQEDRDAWLKLHYAGTGYVDGYGWNGTIWKQRLYHCWFLVYAAIAVMIPWLCIHLHRMFGVALRAFFLLVASGALLHAILLLHEAINSDRVMIGFGGWIGLAGVGVCIGAGWIRVFVHETDAE